MGSFIGHLSPGSFFILFSIRWLFVLMSTYYNQQRASSRGQNRVFKSSTTFPFRCCQSKTINYESWIKVICCAVGITGEFVTSFNSKWEFVNYGNSQHMVMFFFYGINGVVEIVMTKDDARIVGASNSDSKNIKPGRLPPGTEYFSVMVAVFVEGLLFAFHLHGRNALDVHVHTLLIISIAATFFSVANEWMHRGNILATIVRALCFLMQGTWFVQVII